MAANSLILHEIDSMKKYYILLLSFMLPFLGQAQVNHAEDFTTGDVLLYMVCTMPDSPGSAGTAVIWDFSSALDSGNGQHTTWVLDDTAVVGDQILSAFPYLNNTGNRIHKSGGRSFLAAVLSPSLTYTYDSGALVLDQALSYGLVDSNSFTSVLTNATNTLTGGGTAMIEVDGSGTLKTPAGNYNNVLRVKRIIDNVDSFTNNSLHNYQVSYLWYDDLHTAPLFRIDSIYRSGTGIFQNSVATGSASYLQAVFAAGVKPVANSRANASVHLDDNGLVLNAQLENAGEYRISILDMQGRSLYSNTFRANGSSWQFNPGRQFPVGTYVIEIKEAAKTGRPILLKTVKE